MNEDFTQQQTLNELEKAERLSLQAHVPPVELEGYQLLEQIGQGAFGQVWLALDLNTSRKVAIKFYASRSSVNLSLINREVSHLVSMSTGTGIVQVLKVGWDAQPPYYIMEYLENGSLEDLIREKESLSPGETTRLFREIAEGLSYAHSKGVLHCDLKPANVMLDHNLHPRLADFGQSRLSDEQTPSLGTLFFMAPEQADLKAVPDAAWDVYALGAIAYAMLAGEPPHRSQELLSQLDGTESLKQRLQLYREAIQNASPPNGHYQQPGVDKRLCQIIDRCLIASPEHRFNNVEQVIAALDQWKEQKSRRPLLLFGIVAPILFLLLMLFFSTRSVSVAKHESVQSVQQWALRSNQFAAQLAAQSLESEFAALFQLIEREARRPELAEHVASILNQEQELLDTLATAEATNPKIALLRGQPKQRTLETYLQSRIEELLADDASKESIFDSMFINDSRGTNLGIHFVEEQQNRSAQSPVGRNFAYRSYFNGLAHDASASADRSQFQPVQRTHLSSVFQSTSTGKLKVGISAPIRSKAQSSILGVLVLTINLGDFELLSGLKYDEEGNRHQRFASLVDGREGNRQGTLLQHPYLSERPQETSDGEVPTGAPQIDIRITEQLLAESAIVDYLDPASAMPDGADYEGTWIAAMQEVHLPTRTTTANAKQSSAAAPLRSEESRPTSNLWVLVQEKSTTVAEPVEALGNRLHRETLIELLSLVVVVITLWGLVFRSGVKSQLSI